MPDPFIAVSPQPKPNDSPLGGLTELLMSPAGLILLACGLIFAVLALMGGGDVPSRSTPKNAKAKARWAEKKELFNARKLAIKQLNGRNRKSACVWIIRPASLEYPESVLKRKKLKNGKTSTTTPAPEQGAIPKETPVKVGSEKHSWHDKDAKCKKTAETIWIPDTQRSVMVIGAPGSGKTFSAIDPMIRSVIEQGHPIILYDFKYPAQTSAVAWYAEQLGYEISVFAPGFPESSVLNLLDFLTGDAEDDAPLARQLANTMNKNFRIGATGGGDPFFDAAGDQLVQAVIMLAKQMPYADLIMVNTILNMPQLIERICPESSGIDPWIRQAFGQIFSVKDSEKTVSSIVGTASLNFSRLMMARILACCVGKTTLPLDMNGKQMVVFGMDRELRDVVGPIIATVIHMLVNRNLFREGGRKDPLFCVLDELPTIYLPQLVNWENESRSDGFNGIIGFQNKSQLEKIYGREMTLAIMGGCATKFIFNPGEVESSEYFSKFFGDEEIARRNKSRSTSGGKGGNSFSHSVEVGTRKLIAPEEFLMLQPGEAIFTNPQYESKDGAYFPRRQKFNLPPWEIKLAGQIESNWHKTHERLLKSTVQTIPNRGDIISRSECFQEQFPVPDPEEAATGKPTFDALASIM